MKADIRIDFSEFANTIFFVYKQRQDIYAMCTIDYFFEA